MSAPLEKLVQATMAHRDMRHATEERALELAAELEDERRQRTQDPDQPTDAGAAAGDNSGQGPNS